MSYPAIAAMALLALAAGSAARAEPAATAGKPAVDIARYRTLIERLGLRR